MTGNGSSPLTRGKRTTFGQNYFGLRLIPAHAGKTIRSNPLEVAPVAHPRSRGENTTGQLTKLRLPGSSPLTRGKPGVEHASAQDKRLIPAHAGKTVFDVPLDGGGQAHPRSRGENTC